MICRKRESEDLLYLIDSMLSKTVAGMLSFQDDVAAAVFCMLIAGLFGD